MSNENWKASGEQRENLTLVKKCFNEGMFVGRLVINWCPKCKGWKTHYVSAQKLSAPILDEIFPCGDCQTKLPLIVDAKHTVIDNVPRGGA